MAAVEAERFRREYEREHQVPDVTAALAIAAACLRANANEHDRGEIGQFLPRVLRAALAAGAWADAREAAARAARREPRAVVRGDVAAGADAAGLDRAHRREARHAGRRRRSPSSSRWRSALGDAGVDWITLVLSESPGARDAPRARRVDRRALPREPRAPRAVAGGRALVRGAQHRAHPGLDRRRPTSEHAGDRARAIPTPRVRDQVVAALTQARASSCRGRCSSRRSRAPTRSCSARSCTSSRRPRPGDRAFRVRVPAAGEVRDPRPRRSGARSTPRSPPWAATRSCPTSRPSCCARNWFDAPTEMHRHNVARSSRASARPLARGCSSAGAQSRRAPVRQAARGRRWRGWEAPRLSEPAAPPPDPGLDAPRCSPRSARPLLVRLSALMRTARTYDVVEPGVPAPDAASSSRSCTRLLEDGGRDRAGRGRRLLLPERRAHQARTDVPARGLPRPDGRLRAPPGRRAALPARRHRRPSRALLPDLHRRRGPGGRRAPARDRAEAASRTSCSCPRRDVDAEDLAPRPGGEAEATRRARPRQEGVLARDARHEEDRAARAADGPARPAPRQAPRAADRGQHHEARVLDRRADRAQGPRRVHVRALRERDRAVDQHGPDAGPAAPGARRPRRRGAAARPRQDAVPGRGAAQARRARPPRSGR